MVNRQALLSDLQDLLRTLEADLLERSESDEVPGVGEKLRAEYERARSAQRTAQNYEDWRSDAITQAAAAWVLSCVFVRFLEDNRLIAPPKLAGPPASPEGDQLQRARDEHELYFRQHPRQTDRDYLLSVFDELARLPGTKDVFGEHNPIRELPNWLSGDAAGELLHFFQRIDANTGALVHDFTDSNWDTRFLGDLYQDLSEAARKKYALLQTPEFVEEFILDRTLDPALEEFGLTPVATDNGQQTTDKFKLIDPACGSGHFLLGAFPRLLARWQKKEPGTKVRALVQRALDSIHGVDVNPYAIAIARFRLLLVAMKACGIRRLADAPAFQFNLACGDSLLHGPGSTIQQTMGDWAPIHHAYMPEDLSALQRILQPGAYHAVVANPPYITPKDRQLNQAYRERYDACHMKYSLAVPFMQRLFQLAIKGNGNGSAAGYVGQITANSFMKREFGKKLIEYFLPQIDLTHVIDTSGAYIPGHGTPTVILFGRRRAPVASTIRTVMGIRGEPTTPDDPARGLVWTAITAQLDCLDLQSEFVSVADSLRLLFLKHPWSIGGGGAAELKERLDTSTDVPLSDVTSAIGVFGMTNADEVFQAPRRALARRCVEKDCYKRLIIGDEVRDWKCLDGEDAIFPYSNGRLISIRFRPHLDRWMWPARTVLGNRATFARKTYFEEGRPWWEWHQTALERLNPPLTITLAFVATHNHFMLDRGESVFNRSAPIIKLRKNATENDYLAVLGLLNSSVACFWLQQTMHNKGGPGGASSKDEKWHDFYEIGSTRLEDFPLPEVRPTEISRKLDSLAQSLSQISADLSKPSESNILNNSTLDSRRSLFTQIRHQMISLQEELDWCCYQLYGLTDDNLTHNSDPPAIKLGQRAFEIVLARKMLKGELVTKWFDWLNIAPITEVPNAWPADYQRLVQRRIERIESDPNVALIEQVSTKRRWESEPWESQTVRALREWLLNRLESYFDFDGRMNDNGEPTAEVDIGLISVAKLADIANHDPDFHHVGAALQGDMAFDIPRLVTELVGAESVPLLPALRYKEKGLRKRAEWEQTWELQRREDELAAQRERARQRIQQAKERVAATLTAEKADVDARRQALWDDCKRVRDRFATDFETPDSGDPNIAVLMLGQHGVASDGRAALQALEEHRKQYFAKACEFDSKVNALCESDGGYQAAIRELESIPEDPEIAVPPKYTSADFQKSDYWRLRGKLDVPKERWVSFPHCEGPDGTLMIAWAGYDHLQLARAISAYYVDVQERLGGRDDPRLVPLLACLLELIPWLKQWHNTVDPEFGLPMGDYFEGFVNEEARGLDKTTPEIKAWTPPARVTRRRQSARRQAST